MKPDSVEQDDLFVSGLTKVNIKRLKRKKKKKKTVIFKQSDLFERTETSVRVDTTPKP